jgi:hypothetical protein
MLMILFFHELQQEQLARKLSQATQESVATGKALEIEKESLRIQVVPSVSVHSISANNTFLLTSSL